MLNTNRTILALGLPKGLHASFYARIYVLLGGIWWNEGGGAKSGGNPGYAV
jgi:hypothetical protein